MHFADGFVVDDPLTFCYFLEGGFAANIFRFGSHYWFFWIHRSWCDWVSIIFFTEFGVLDFF